MPPGGQARPKLLPAVHQVCGTSDLEIGWGVRGTGRDCHNDRGTLLLRSSSPRLPRCSVPRGVEVAIAGGQGGAHRRLCLLRPDLVVAESRRCRPPRCAGRCCRWRPLPPSTPVVMAFHGAPSSSAPGLRFCRFSPGPSCRVQDLASEFSITVGGASKVVDRVEAAGYCRRRANPDDRRSSIIELTPAGRRVLARATPIFEDELQIRIGSVLPDASLRRFGAAPAELRAAHRKARAA
jgi:DNA-binding MarR family transcriptional regulator